MDGESNERTLEQESAELRAQLAGETEPEPPTGEAIGSQTKSEEEGQPLQKEEATDSEQSEESETAEGEGEGEVDT